MKDKRNIRSAVIADLGTVLNLIDSGRKTMMASGNTRQWDASHPSHKQIEEDIAGGVSYLLTEDGRPIATFAFMPGPEPTYARIYGGKWLNDNPYHVIHRVAGLPGYGGVFYDILDWCFKRTDNIRIDTHRDNKIMRHCLEKYSFAYCGIIHLANGDERFAYQKTIIRPAVL